MPAWLEAGMRLFLPLAAMAVLRGLNAGKLKGLASKS
jgi:hypothetical protein